MVIEKTGSEAPSNIYVGVYTTCKKNRGPGRPVKVLYVEMDGVLNQPNTQRSAIGKNLPSRDKIKNTYKAIKTLVSIMSCMTFLTASKSCEVHCQTN